jgi:hypothetical protein
MKKMIFSACLIIFAISTSVAINPDPKSEPESPAVTAIAENNLSEDEINILIARVEEIRDMDKSNLTATERRDLRRELKAIKEDVRRQGGYIYIGAGTLLVILILVLLLL